MGYLIFLICLIIAAPWISWLTHVSMNKDQHKPYDFVNFNTFLREFDKYKNDPDLEFGWDNKSIFLRKKRAEVLYIHADVIKINGKCMIFYPLDFIKYKIWIRKFRKKSNRVKGLWNVDYSEDKMIRISKQYPEYTFIFDEAGHVIDAYKECDI